VIDREARKVKVFGIGFHKTGTKSLARALHILGYAVTGPNYVHDPDIARNALWIAKELAQKFDAFQDNPWPILFREMDEAFPGSKFILTVRPTGDWIDSVVNHFGSKSTPMREWIYGIGMPQGHEQIYRARYEKHNREVLSHFSRRTSDLLVLNFQAGDGWDRLCPFLGADIPAQQFPHVNRRA
jgi:hypothetical protein